MPVLVISLFSEVSIKSLYIMFDIILNYYVRNATPLLLNRFDCFLHWSI